jgi:DNA-binding NtrC family response regulator
MFLCNKPPVRCIEKGAEKSWRSGEGKALKGCMGRHPVAGGGSETEAAEMNGKALLIIHDPAMVAALSKTLTRPDLAMSFSTKLGDALGTLSKSRMDIVFCEARLPDGSFREVIRFLEGSGRKALFVVCSNFYDQRTEAEAASLGAREYLTFPFSRHQVQRLADQALAAGVAEQIASRSKAAA